MRAQRGSAPVELALATGLLLVPIALLVLSFGPWLERRSFVRAAAHEAARLEVVSTGDEPGVVALVAAMAVGNGLDPAEVSLSLCGGPATTAGAALRSSCLPLARGGLVTVEVQTRVPLVRTPFGDVGGVMVAARGLEAVDLYRSLP